jgi:hypothetical protein
MHALDHGRLAVLLFRRPLFWTLVAAASGLAICESGLAAGVVTAVAIGSIGLFSIRHPAIRNRLERAEHDAAWRSRCDARTTELDHAGVRTDGLDEVTGLVRELWVTDPTLSRHLELETLLDHYVVVALRARRCEQMLAKTQRTTSRPPTTDQQIDLRRVAMRAKLQQRLRDSCDELAAVCELLCLLVQRSTLEASQFVGDPVGDRLALFKDEPVAA